MSGQESARTVKLTKDAWHVLEPPTTAPNAGCSQGPGYKSGPAKWHPRLLPDRDEAELQSCSAKQVQGVDMCSDMRAFAGFAIGFLDACLIGHTADTARRFRDCIGLLDALRK